MRHPWQCSTSQSPHSDTSALATLVALPHPPGSRLLLLLPALLLLLLCMLLPASSRPSGRGTGASSGMPALLGSPCRQEGRIAYRGR